MKRDQESIDKEINDLENELTIIGFTDMVRRRCIKCRISRLKNIDKERERAERIRRSKGIKPKKISNKNTEPEKINIHF